MNELAGVEKGAGWRRLKSFVLDSVSSSITKRVYNLGLDEFFEWYSRSPGRASRRQDAERLRREKELGGFNVRLSEKAAERERMPGLFRRGRIDDAELDKHRRLAIGRPSSVR